MTAKTNKYCSTSHWLRLPLSRQGGKDRHFAKTPVHGAKPNCGFLFHHLTSTCDRALTGGFGHTPPVPHGGTENLRGVRYLTGVIERIDPFVASNPFAFVEQGDAPRDVATGEALCGEAARDGAGANGEDR